MSCIPCSVADHLLWHCLPPNPHLQNTMQMSSSSFPHHPIPWSQPAILPSKFSLETYKSICPWKQTGRKVGRLSLDFYFPFSCLIPSSVEVCLLWPLLLYHHSQQYISSLLWVPSGPSLQTIFIPRCQETVYTELPWPHWQDPRSIPYQATHSHHTL